MTNALRLLKKQIGGVKEELIMSLTQCPNCHRRCFTDAASCPNCFQIFKPGALQAYAVAEEKSFSAKTNILFLGLFLTWLAVLLVLHLRGYLDGTGT